MAGEAPALERGDRELFNGASCFPSGAQQPLVITWLLPMDFHTPGALVTQPDGNGSPRQVLTQGRHYHQPVHNPGVRGCRRVTCINCSLLFLIMSKFY